MWPGTYYRCMSGLYQEHEGIAIANLPARLIVRLLLLQLFLPLMFCRAFTEASDHIRGIYKTSSLSNAARMGSLR